MTAGAAILARLEAASVHLRAAGGNLVARPKEALTDELRALIREHKAQLLAVLAGEQFKAPGEQAELSPNPAAEDRRQRVTAMLEERPHARYALVVDEHDPDFPGCVVLAVGIRSDPDTIRVCDLIVPQERYDGFALLDLINRHGQVLH